MTAQMDRDLQGQPLARPQPVDVTFAEGLTFDGQTAVLRGEVEVRTAQQELRTDQLEIKLQQRINLDQPAAARGAAVQVALIRCRGQVFLENRTPGPQGLLAVDQVELRDLDLDQVTGNLTGAGPGWLKTVRRGEPRGLQLSPAGAPAPRAASTALPLSYVYVQFQRGVRGNILPARRELTFADRVRTVYDRVADWNAQPQADDPDLLSPDGALLQCDQLTLREMPSAGSPPQYELEAQGSTVVEGQSFTARGHRISYAQAKDLLVLEGDGRADARLFHQARPGAPTANWAARKIMFWRSTGRVEVSEGKLLDLGNLPNSSPRK
jgi:lipopolysaccharide export system protein LptA